MSGDLPTMGQGDNKCAEKKSTGEQGTIGRQINILGEPVHLRIGAVRGQLGLADIVPLARMVCEKVTSTVVEVLKRDGCRVPCGRGCWACCRYLVPLSIPEVFRLNEEVLARPVSQQRQILQACLLAAEQILKHSGPQMFVGHTTEGNTCCPTELDTLSRWYAGLNLTCPFLGKEVCIIYEQRPLACREYFITGSPSVCAGRDGEGQRIAIVVRMSEVLGRLASELEGTDVEAVIMPFAPVWAQENRERGKRTWSGQMMVERFVDIVTEMASESSAAMVAAT